MSSRALTIGLFLSIALNLFLVGLLAGGWREYRDRSGAAAVPAIPEAVPPPAALEPVPATPAPVPSAAPVVVPPPPQAGGSGMAVRSVPLPRQGDPGPPPVQADSPDMPPLAKAAAPAGAFPERPPFRPPESGPGPYRPPMGNSLILASRDLPPRQRREFQALLRAESEAVRMDLQLARQARADAWRGLSRGDLTSEEARRILEQARRRELAARVRVEMAVAEWAQRQPPAVRTRIGDALAGEGASGPRRPVRPWAPSADPQEGPPPPPAAAEERN